MKLFDLLKMFKRKTSQRNEVKVDSYTPSLWEDDYCQIEIVPFENKEYIMKMIEQINDVSNESGTDNGFTETFERSQMPTSTFSKQLRAEYLQQLFAGFEFEKATNINYDSHKILDCKTGPVKAWGFPNFTVFFDVEEAFVKNIWLSVNSIIEVKQYNLIKSALYTLGEECEMVLVDWNSLESFDLRHKNQIGKYLRSYFNNRTAHYPPA